VIPNNDNRAGGAGSAARLVGTGGAEASGVQDGPVPGGNLSRSFGTPSLAADAR